MKKSLFVLSLIGMLAGLLVLRSRVPDPNPPPPPVVADATSPIEAVVAAPPAQALPTEPPPGKANAPQLPPDFGLNMARQCDPDAPMDSERMRRNASLASALGDRSPTAEERRVEDVLWLLQNAPDSQCIASFGRLARGSDGDNQALALLKSLADDEHAPVGVLANYARWLASVDPAGTLVLYGRLQALEPTNPDWLTLEASLHMRDTNRKPLGDEDAAASATLAMEALADALQHAQPGSERQGTLADAVKAAAIAGDYAAAEEWGRELLSNLDPEHPDPHARWTAHEGLGLAALGRGEPEGAIAELLQMSDVPPGPVQRSFGPSMRLADQLLQAGHRDAVIKYLEKVGTFWKPDKVDAWLERLRDGETFTLNRFG